VLDGDGVLARDFEREPQAGRCLEYANPKDDAWNNNS
jgi:hypothetical protein